MKKVLAALLLFAILSLSSCAQGAETETSTENGAHSSSSATEAPVYDPEIVSKTKKEAVEFIYDMRRSLTSVFDEYRKDYIITDISPQTYEYISQKDGITTAAYTSGDRMYSVKSGDVVFSLLDRNGNITVEDTDAASGAMPSVFYDFGIDTSAFAGEFSALCNATNLPEISEGMIGISSVTGRCTVSDALARYFAKKALEALGYTEQEAEDAMRKTFSHNTLYDANERELSIYIHTEAFDMSIIKRGFAEEDGSSVSYHISADEYDEDILSEKERAIVFSNMRFQDGALVYAEIEYAEKNTNTVFGSGDAVSLKSETAGTHKYVFDISGDIPAFAVSSKTENMITLGEEALTYTVSEARLACDETGKFGFVLYMGDALVSSMEGTLEFNAENIPSMPARAWEVIKAYSEK